MARCSAAGAEAGKTHAWITLVLLALYGVASSGSSGPNELSGAEQLRSLGLGLVDPDQQVDKEDVRHAQAMKITKYTRCELADALRDQDVPEEHIPVWVCLAHSFTDLDLSVVKKHEEGSYYGLFQFSDQWWCDVGAHMGCHIPCSVLLDSLEANVQCAKKVYAEWRVQKGDGFLAWESPRLTKCRNATDDFVGSCNADVSHI